MRRGRATFRERTFILNVWLFLGALLAAQGLLAILYFWAYPDEGDPVRRFIVFGLAIGGVCLGLYFVTYALGRLHGRRAPIVIGPAGLHDRSVSERAIAWSDVTEVRLRFGGRGGPYIVFEIQPGAEDRAGVWPVRRRMASVARFLGYDGYRVHHEGTDATLESLVSAINAYAVVRR